MWSRWFGAPGAHSGPLYRVITTSGASSVIDSFGRVADVAVGEIPELHVVHADDGGRPPLLAFAKRACFFGRHALDTRLAAAGQCVVHGLAGRRPLGDCGRAAVFGVIGMGH